MVVGLVRLRDLPHLLVLRPPSLGRLLDSPNPVLPRLLALLRMSLVAGIHPDARMTSTRSCLVSDKQVETARLTLSSCAPSVAGRTVRIQLGQSVTCGGGWTEPPVRPMKSPRSLGVNPPNTPISKLNEIQIHEISCTYRIWLRFQQPSPLGVHTSVTIPQIRQDLQDLSVNHVADIASRHRKPSPPLTPRGRPRLDAPLYRRRASSRSVTDRNTA